VVWLGYDNAGGRRRTLGSGVTGGSAAVPIFEPIIQAAWDDVAPKQVLVAPSAEAARQLSCTSIDVEPAEGRRRSRSAATECFRLDRRGRIVDSRYRLVARENNPQDRDETAIRGRAERAYAFENQTRGPWDGLWQGAPHWRSHWENDSYGHHRPRVFQPRVFQPPRRLNFMYYRRH
jgi:membrane carboxypeptidase/penicillin-binding protein